MDASIPPHDTRPLTARRTVVVLVVTLAFALGVLFIYEVRSVIAWLLVATLLAVALDPAVGFLTRHRWRRGWAALLVSFLFLIAVLGIAAALATPLVTQAKELVVNLPQYVRDLFKAGSPLEFLDTRFNIVDRIRDLDVGTVWRVIVGGGTTIVSALSKSFYWLFATLTTFTLMVMLLVEGPRAWGGFLSFFEPERHEWVKHLGARMAKAVGGYVRGNLMISAIAAVFAYIVLSILGIPYPVPLALTVGVLDIIPLVGATIGAVICVLLAFTQGWLPAVILIGYFVVYQQVENNFIQPMVYSRTARLTPLTVLLASLVGATLAGILGVLVAIPLTSAVMIFIQESRGRRGPGKAQVFHPLERLEASAQRTSPQETPAGQEGRPTAAPPLPTDETADTHTDHAEFAAEEPASSDL